MSTKFVLVTGGAGYIGSHACKSLSKKGYTPVTIDNLITGWKENVKYGPFEQVDLLDKKSLNSVFKLYKPIAVMHFAALSEVADSVNNPGLYWKNNVCGTLNLLEAAVENRCLDLIFSSTCAIFGEQDNIVLDEISPQSPLSPYGKSKLAVEKMIMDFKTAYGLEYVIFRYFNVAGADPEAEIGECHNPETHLIPLVLNSIIERGTGVTIFGTDYSTPDGTCIRDYVHVCDVINAHLLGLEWLLKNKESRIFNLGTGDGFSVREVLEKCKLVTNRDFPVLEGARRPGDCARLVSGSKRAFADLGWKASQSNLKQMITDAWRWHQKQNQFNITKKR